MAITVLKIEINENQVANILVNHFLDITSEICPLTFVKTKLVIEKMKPGDTLEVRLCGAEPLRNVPRSVAELGHIILSLIPEQGENGAGIHRLSIRKGF
jgi:TusA-related sulfurtransferase